MKTQTPVVKVLFRRSPNGEVTAVFPEVPHSAVDSGLACVCYAHTGQHGACNQSWSARQRPAVPVEYASLLKELAGLGYVLEIVNKFPRNAHQTRRAAIANH